MEANEDGSLAELDFLQRNASSTSVPCSNLLPDTVRYRVKRLNFHFASPLGRYILLVRYDRASERRPMEPSTALRALGHRHVSSP